MDPSLPTVFLAALVTALATGLGALPLLWRRSLSAEWLGVASAVAAGVMLAASVQLLVEGGDVSWWRAAAGALGGVVFIGVTRRLLRRYHHLEVGALHGADARKAFMIVAVMTAHSLTEGVGVGVSFGGGEELGLFITIAIAVHNIPEGLAISLVLVPRGVRVRTAALWSVFSSLPQPLMALPAFAFVDAFLPVLPVGLGFAAGAMVWMVLVELLPDARAAAPARLIVPAGLAAFGAMMAFQLLVL